MSSLSLYAPGFCDLHSRFNCSLCDECGHDSERHLSAHDDSTLWSRVTCWSENVCLLCEAISAAKARS